MSLSGGLVHGALPLRRAVHSAVSPLGGLVHGALPVRRAVHSADPRCDAARLGRRHQVLPQPRLEQARQGRGTFFVTVDGQSIVMNYYNVQICKSK